MTALDRVLIGLEKAKSLDDLQGWIEKLRDCLGVDHVVYHWVSAQGEQYGCGTYDRAWVERYVERDYLKVDPVVTGCLQRFHPVDWRQLDWSSKAAGAFLKDAMAHNLGHHGFSVPIRGPNGQFALFSVSTSASDAEWDTFTHRHRRDLILIAHLVNERGLEFEGSRVPSETTALSPRESEVLGLLAMGMNRANAADTLSISEHTLRAYIESARFKLGALNTTHAVARAVERGLIVVGGAARGAQGGWPQRGIDLDPSAANSNPRIKSQGERA